MHQPLDISEVCRRTGLTSRALRFYEARGLVAPLRTYSGRRLYGPAELERINLVVTLKRAGLTLSQIGKLTGQGSLNLA
jgi:DNA-binding transcriptional MerR regulator